MTDLRKTAEMALEALEITWATECGFFDNRDKITGSVKALRQALENEPEEIIELRQLMQDPSVTGVLLEVHRGPLSKSIREYGECSCPTNKEGDVILEVTHE